MYGQLLAIHSLCLFRTVDYYQMRARLFAGMKSFWPFLTLKALYQASMWGRVALTRALLGE